jgi:hypothetical protein
MRASSLRRAWYLRWATRLARARRRSRALTKRVPTASRSRRQPRRPHSSPHVIAPRAHLWTPGLRHSAGPREVPYFALMVRRSIARSLLAVRHSSVLMVILVGAVVSACHPASAWPGRRARRDEARRGGALSRHRYGTTMSDHAPIGVILALVALAALAGGCGDDDDCEPPVCPAVACQDPFSLTVVDATRLAPGRSR